MPIRFHCPCGQQISAREDYAGKRAQCNKCKRVLTIPTFGSASAPTKIRPRPSSGATVVPGGAAPRTVPVPPAPSLAPKSEVPLGAPAPSASAVPSGVPMPRAAATMLAPTSLTGPQGIHFRCGCGGSYQARPSDAGQPTRCPRCGEILFIPSRRTAQKPGVPAPVVSHDSPDRYQPKTEGLTGQARIMVIGLVVLVLGVFGWGFWELYLKHVAEGARSRAPAVRT